MLHHHNRFFGTMCLMPIKNDRALAINNRDDIVPLTPHCARSSVGSISQPSTPLDPGCHDWHRHGVSSEHSRIQQLRRAFSVRQDPHKGIFDDVNHRITACCDAVTRSHNAAFIKVHCYIVVVIQVITRKRNLQLGSRLIARGNSILQRNPERD